MINTLNMIVMEVKVKDKCLHAACKKYHCISSCGEIYIYIYIYIYIG